MRYVLIVLILCMTTIASCDDTANLPATAGFNKQPTLLMTLPAGYESGEVVFSNDGFQAAVILKKDGKAFMSINSVLSSMFDDVRSPVFHANSKKYAFVAKKDGKECVVFNGKEGEFYDSVRSPIITGDARLIYAAKRNDKWFIVSGNKVSQAFNSPDPSLYVSPDGKRLAFVEKNSTTNKLNLCVCSNKFKDYARGSGYDEISAVSSNLSGSHLVYKAAKNGKQAVVIFDFRQPGCGEKEDSWYDKVGTFAVSNNGEHVAFFAQIRGDYYMVAAGKEWPCTDYKMLFDISVSDKGNVLYTGAIKLSIILSLDGKVVSDRLESIDSPLFSSDSSHSLFLAGPCPFIPPSPDRSEKSYLVIDGHDSKKYDKIVNPRFTPDNAHVVFRAREAGKRFVVVADNTGKIIKEHPAYESVWEWNVSPDGKFIGYGVKSGQELWWKVEPINTLK